MFLPLLAAVTIGTVIGNGILFWLIGIQAKRVEQKQIKMYQAMQRETEKVRKQEAERMRKYAKMES
jgi:membrane protein YqaA with SNARE-associated domain